MLCHLIWSLHWISNSSGPEGVQRRRASLLT